MFPTPVTLDPKETYTISALVDGSSTVSGSDGLVNVVTEDAIDWKFMSATGSVNGTDVYSGQIPELYYTKFVLLFLLENTNNVSKKTITESQGSSISS